MMNLVCCWCILLERQWYETQKVTIRTTIEQQADTVTTGIDKAEFGMTSTIVVLVVLVVLPVT